MTKQAPVEIEVKFYAPNLRAIRERVLATGGVLRKPYFLEVNLRFEDSEDTLTPSGKVLRLRQNQGAWLTYKRPGPRSSGVKIRVEHEVEVSDFDAARAILEELGYHVSWAYEKYREGFGLGLAEISLDQLPFGDFVEVEAPDEQAVRTAAAALQLDWEQRRLDSYADLFSTVRRTRALAFRDLTFENFRGLAIARADLGL